MGLEIERKFLLRDAGWRSLVDTRVRIVQGYLANTDSVSVRVRLAEEQASLNIKGMIIGPQRPEFEYSIPVTDARYLLDNLCRSPLIRKTRHYLECHGNTWEIDEFENDNAGLIVAELELQSPDAAVELPDWIGDEVTQDARYYNVNLVQHPFSAW